MGIKKKLCLTEEQQHQRLLAFRTLVEDNETIVKSGIDINDQFLAAFLRGRKYNVEHAYQTIEKYVDVRIRKYAKFFVGVTPMALMYLHEQPRFSGLLKYRDPVKGCLILVARPPDVGKLRSFDDAVGSLNIGLEESLYIEESTKAGVIAVMSGEGCGLSHMREITPARIKMAVDLSLNSYPYKFKKLHVVHCSSILSMLIAMVKPFLPRKLRERIVVHRNIETLYEHIPQYALPYWLGGYNSEDDYSEIFDFGPQMRIFDKQEYYENFSKKLAEGLK